MTNRQAIYDLLELDRTGQSVPAVDVSLILKAWEMLPSATNPFTVSDAVGPSAFVRACTLRDLFTAGSLKPWQHGADLDAFVFEEAASFPFGNREEFVRHLSTKK